MKNKFFIGLILLGCLVLAFYLYSKNSIDHSEITSEHSITKQPDDYISNENSEKSIFKSSEQEKSNENEKPIIKNSSEYSPPRQSDDYKPNVNSEKPVLKPSEQEKFNEDEKQAIKIVERFLTAFCAKSDSIGEYLYFPNDNDPEYTQTLEYLADNMSFQIINAEVKEDGMVEVMALIRTIDVYGALMQVWERAEKGEDISLINSIGTDISKLADIGILLNSTDFEAEFIIDNTKEKIYLTSTSSNALSGGINQFVYEVTENAVNEYENS